ncbi:hypothetical protein [Delftia sp. RIT313]|uniref:hypothetical protein n=1 Tax=Delftia sp. RIT313 TaxID=1468410 RepID=UPI00044BEC21|nr:hypothetical protein [Delftia sp. RIT313]EZP62919.1 hypothetical protein BW39_00376 [Delftia sp. RIT313]
MNGRRKPFRSRWAGRPDTFAVINHHGTKLTSKEIASIIDPVRECFAQIRAGTATEVHATVMHSTIQVAQEVERGDIVHGLAEHFDSAQAACEAYFARCRAGGAWHPSAVHFYELDALTTAIDLHEFQLQQLTAHEIQEVTRKLIARTESSGGEMLKADSNLVTTRPYRKSREEAPA